MNARIQRLRAEIDADRGTLEHDLDRLDAFLRDVAAALR